MASFTNSASTQVLIRLGQGKLLSKTLPTLLASERRKKKEIFVNGLFRCSAFPPFLSLFVFFPFVGLSVPLMIPKASALSWWIEKPIPPPFYL